MDVVLEAAVLRVPSPSASAAPNVEIAVNASRRLSDPVGGSLNGTVSSLTIVCHQYFVYDQSMNVEFLRDAAAASIAATIGEPTRARMLFCLLDGHARTSTELAIVADVSPSTASVHLARLKAQRLVKVLAQGRHRYYRLNGDRVAATLEALLVVAGDSRDTFVPTTSCRLRTARTCYDHMAGAVAVSLHDRLREKEWLSVGSARSAAFDLTETGTRALTALGIDIDALRVLRRRFAYACVDWSERRPHLGGALGAALLAVALKRRWVTQDLDSRVLKVTRFGACELKERFGLAI